MHRGARQEQIRSRREQWRVHMEAWSQSGQTQAAYCEQHGLNVKTFSYWRRRLKTDNQAVRLVQLPGRALRQAEGTTLRVVVDDRLTIEVADGFNPATLARTVEVLRGL
jgi:surfactin synthase thioesterase subunit